MRVKRSFLSLVLCFAMCLSFLPMCVFADQLDPSMNPHWNGTVAEWNAVDTAIEYYYYIFKDGTGEVNFIHDGAGKTSNTYVDFAEVIASYGPGVYYFDIGAWDGTETIWSEFSAGYNYTVPVVTPYNVWVGGTQITSANKDDVLGDGKVSYDPESITLTLESGTVINYLGDDAAIKASSSLTVNMLGDVEINSSKDGIEVSELEIIGNGNLNITSDSIGIDTNGVSISISGDVNITVKSGYGISSGYTVTIDGNVNITATGDCQSAIWSMSRISINGNLNILNSDTGIFNDGLNAAYPGSSIEVTGNVTSTTIKKGLYANGGDQGIVVGGNVNITVTGEDAIAINIPYGTGPVSIGGNATITGTNSDIAINTVSGNISIGGDLIVSGFKKGLITDNGTVIMQADTTWDISTTEIAVESKEIDISDNQITLPEDGVIGAYGEGEAIFESDGITVATHVIIEFVCTHTNTEVRNDVDATCTEDGYTGDLYCVDCDEKLEDGNVITALGHVDADLDGECDRCDEDMSVDYNMTSGDGSEWTKGTTDTLVFVSDAEFSIFMSVEVDGVEVSATNYDAVSGSTKVTLSASYLETLAVGNHTIAIVSSNGVATGAFSIKAAVEPTPSDDPTPTPGEDPTPTPGTDPTPAPGEDPTPTPVVTPVPTPTEAPTATPTPTVAPTAAPTTPGNGDGTPSTGEAQSYNALFALVLIVFAGYLFYKRNEDIRANESKYKVRKPNL